MMDRVPTLEAAGSSDREEQASQELGGSEC